MSYIRRIMQRFRANSEGQALVEFALVTPFLLVFLVGIIEFGRAWNAHQIITDAAREAARKAVIFDPAITEDSVRRAAAITLQSGSLRTDSMTVIISPALASAVTGEYVAVTVQWPYKFVFFGQLKQWTTGESRLLLQARSVMRKE